MQAATDADLDAAMEAATSAQQEWGAMTGGERARVLRRVADLLTQHNDQLAMLETLDTGRPVSETLWVDAVSARDCFEWAASLAHTVQGRYVATGGDNFAYVRREPIGVTAGIGAWNYPLYARSSATTHTRTLEFALAHNTPQPHFQTLARAPKTPLVREWPGR